MPDDSIDPAAAREIDVRELPRERRHPLIFDAYDALEVGQALILVNDHEPRHLREEFELELPGSFAWEPEPAPADGQEFRVRITKRARTPLPRLVADTTLLSTATPDASGSIWRLEPASRDLDSNVIALPPGGEIATHDGPDLDVLVLVLHGSGQLETEVGTTVPLRPGELIWLPRTAQRRFTAGAEGVRYLTIHHRKPTLNITAAPSAPSRP